MKAFTLAEFLVTMVTMLTVVGAVMGAYIYSLRMVQFTKPKLAASDDARQTMALFTEDVRSAFDIKLGVRTNSAFIKLAPFSTQVASAIRILPSTNTNDFVIYYWDGANETLRRTTDSGAGIALARGVTNQMVFTSQDYRGYPRTNDSANLIIEMELKFNQIQFPKAAAGSSNYSDSYQLRARANKRAHF